MKLTLMIFGIPAREAHLPDSLIRHFVIKEPSKLRTRQKTQKSEEWGLSLESALIDSEHTTESRIFWKPSHRRWTTQ